MLLRLSVTGFKNLDDVEVAFGPFTCFYGRNAVGKSNIFDALQFLRLLADRDIQSAAASVRRPSTGSHQLLDLFRDGNADRVIEFKVDLIVPPEVVDDFGRKCRPATTFLRYRVGFRYVSDPAPRLMLVNEHLAHLKRNEVRTLLPFPRAREFVNSAIIGERRGVAFISTRPGDGESEVLLHGDGGSRGRPLPAGRSPFTGLGGTNTADYPTILAARREMQSWRFLHLEPSSLRSPDAISADPHVGEHGGGIAATLYHLARSHGDPQLVYQNIVNQVKRLAPNVADLRVDRDEARDQLVLQARMSGTSVWLGPRSLSEGTLRYLALATMELDPAGATLLAMEEPENGVHPSRISNLVQLLNDFAVDTSRAVSDDNPLRQVVINTHSPDVVRQVEPEDLLLVDEARKGESRTAIVRAISETWRATTMSRSSITFQSAADFITGSPMANAWEEARTAHQLVLDFGRAQ